jgi:hypothetical protein
MQQHAKYLEPMFHLQQLQVIHPQKVEKEELCNSQVTAQVLRSDSLNYRSQSHPPHPLEEYHRHHLQHRRRQLQLQRGKEVQ